MKKVIICMLIVGVYFVLAPWITLADSDYSSWRVLGVARGNADNSANGSKEILVALDAGSSILLVYDWDDNDGLTNARVITNWGLKVLDIAAGDLDNDTSQDIAVAFDLTAYGAGYQVWANKWDGLSIYSSLFIGSWGWRIIGIDIANVDNSNDGSEELVIGFDSGGGTVSVLAYSVAYSGGGLVITNARWVFTMPLMQVYGIEVENVDNSADGSQEVVISHGSLTEAYSWDGTDYGSTLVGNKINLPMPFLYDLGHAEGYADGLNVTHGELLDMLPPGIRKNVEKQQGFANP